MWMTCETFSYLETCYCLCTYLNIEELFCKHWRTLIDGCSGTIKHSTKHLNTHWHSKHISGELAGCAQVVNIGGTFEDLKKQYES